VLSSCQAGPRCAESRLRALALEAGLAFPGEGEGITTPRAPGSAGLADTVSNEPASTRLLLGCGSFRVT
jgi:hypothetical protein